MCAELIIFTGFSFLVVVMMCFLLCCMFLRHLLYVIISVVVSSISCDRARECSFELNADIQIQASGELRDRNEISLMTFIRKEREEVCVSE